MELNGNLSTAKSVAVLVPGMNTTIEGSAANTQTARRFVSATRGDVAAITYLGGPFPRGNPVTGLVDAANPRYALDMAPRLVAFSEDVDRTVDATGRPIPVTYIGHSYGGSIVGTAEALGLTADRTLYVAAAGAGVGVDDPGDWHNRNPDVLRFSMTAPGDFIEAVQGIPGGPHGADPDEMPGVIRLATGHYDDGRLVAGPQAHSGRAELAVGLRGATSSRSSPVIPKPCTSPADYGQNGPMWSRSSPVDGFRLAFDRFGTRGAPAVVLLHGWPGNRHDYRRVVPILDGVADIIVPDLRGFGGSDKHAVSVRHFYSATAQASSIVGLIKELGLSDVVIAGYDVGSRVAQSVARMHPDLVQALVLSPPLPGAGDRVLTAQAQSEFWYQAFHQLPLAAQLIDGNPDAVREYLRHFWNHWSGPNFTLSEDDLDRLVSDYALPGAFTASIAWYRAGAGMIAQSLDRAAARPRHQDPRPDRCALAAARSAFPTRVGRPARAILHRCAAAPRRRRRALHAAGVPRSIRGAYPHPRSTQPRRRLMASAAAMVCLAASSNWSLPSR